jgi:hypothetical protein
MIIILWKEVFSYMRTKAWNQRLNYVILILTLQPTLNPQSASNRRIMALRKPEGQHY